MIESQDASDSTLHEQFIKDFAERKTRIKYDNDPVNSPRAHSSAASDVSATPTTQSIAVVDEATKFAIKQLRKVHSQWDRQCREFQSIITQSKNHDNTQGSKVERELDEVTEKCIKIDSELVQIEQCFMVNGKLTAAEVKQVAQLCTDMKKLIDSGKEKSKGLKSWFALG